MQVLKAIVTISLGFLVAAPPPAWANQDADLVCPVMGELARVVMRVRQNKVPLSEALQKITSPTQDAFSQGLVREIILQAYEVPAYATAKIQEETIADFRNTIEIGCYRTFADGVPGAKAQP